MHYRRLALSLILLWLAGCAASPAEPPAQPVAGGAWPQAVGEVALRVEDETPVPLLDVGVVIFEVGLAEDAAAADGVFPGIRRHETRLLPVRLRQALEASGAWGAVRVQPEAQACAHLQIRGRILHSDGERLVLALRAEDASGRVWLDATYHDISTAGDYPVAPGRDPFADLYRAVANDLLAAREAQPPAALAQLPQVATLRYAVNLAPGAFEDFLARDAAGEWQLRRLPAADDPMLARVRMIRDREYLFVDTVDEQYRELAEALQPAYDLWRQFTREQAQYRADYRARLPERERAGPPGSYAAMEQAYNAFRWSRIQEQDLEELARGFVNEVRPTVLSVDGRVYRLSGSLSAQYAEWRDILGRILALELGLPQETH